MNLRAKTTLECFTTLWGLNQFNNYFGERPRILLPSHISRTEDRNNRKGEIGRSREGDSTHGEGIQIIEWKVGS